MDYTELKNLMTFDRRHLWHPYASMTQPPPVNFAESASGTHIRLADGQELIDAVSSWWCVCHGHNHPKIMEAIRRQSEKLAQVMFAGFTHEPAIRLAELLTERTPAGLNKVFYADSGSVSVECAAKMAIQYQLAAGRSTRQVLASVRGGYHGDTAGAMALSDPDGMHQMFRGILARHHFAPQPVTPFGGNWDPGDFQPMEELLDRHGNEIAAVILESGTNCIDCILYCFFLCFGIHFHVCSSVVRIMYYTLKKRSRFDLRYSFLMTMFICLCMVYI